MWMSFPLAAGAADVIIPILFGLFSFAAWIINTVKKSQEEQARRGAANRRPKDQKVRQEIQEFLQQQKSGRPSRPATPQMDPEDVEVVDEPAGRRRPSPVVQPKKTPKSGRKPAPNSTQTSRPATAPTPAAAPRTPMGQFERGQLGSELREHVSTVMAERVKAQADRDLPHLSSSVPMKVEEDLGIFEVSKKAVSPRVSNTPLIDALRNPTTARQAVLMQEIFGRPKALRK